MNEDACPCMADKARRIKRISINGTNVGIAQLDQVMEEVRDMDLDQNMVGGELLRRVRIFNYVPSSASAEYEKALIDEYERRYPR